MKMKLSITIPLYIHNYDDAQTLSPFFLVYLLNFLFYHFYFSSAQMEAVFNSLPAYLRSSITWSCSLLMEHGSIELVQDVVAAKKMTQCGLEDVNDNRRVASEYPY